MTSEFGRTSKIDPNQGGDHWPRVSSYLITGGEIAGGRVIGAIIFRSVGLDLQQIHNLGILEDKHGNPGLHG